MPANNACRRDGCNGRYLDDVCHACGHSAEPTWPAPRLLATGYRLTERRGEGRLYYLQGNLHIRRDPLIR